jgi:4-aminobutyrate--pyruvate transaminase
MTNAISNSLAMSDMATTLHSCTNSRAHERKGPLIIDHGKGIFVYDLNGKEYIEGMAGL